MNDLVARLDDKKAIRGLLWIYIRVTLQQVAPCLLSHENRSFLTHICELWHSAHPPI